MRVKDPQASAPTPNASPVSSDSIGIPVDLVNEQVLVIAACLDTKTRKGLVQRLRPETFIGTQHLAIWEGLTEISRKDLDFDVATLSQVTGGKADIEYLNKILHNRTEIPPNLRHHAELLMWDKARVDCARGPLQQLLKQFQDTTTTPERLRATARSVLQYLESGGSYKPIDPRLVNEAGDFLLDELSDLIIPFGLPGLDNYEDGKKRMIPGCMPGMTTVVTAVSGCGKSSFLTHLALCQGPGIKHAGIPGMGRKVLYGSWEMPPEILANNMAALSLGIDRSRLFDPKNLTSEQKKAIREEREHILSFVKFQKQPVGRKGVGKATDEALDAIYGMIADSGCDIAIFDLWERAFGFNSESEEKGALIRQQEIAKELKVHCVLAAQQKLKEVEARPDKKPQRDLIKGSSTWVDISDTIIALHLPSRWKAVLPNHIEIHILKQRYARWPLLVDADYNEITGLISGCRSGNYRMAGNDLDDLLASFK